MATASQVAQEHHMWHGITTTQAFQQFEANLDVGTTTYERLQEGIGFVSEAIFATFPIH